MKVGLFIGHNLPESGGKYSLTKEIFQSILEFGAESGHEFVLFGFNEQPPHEIMGYDHIEYISLYRGYYERLKSKASRTVKAIRKKLRHPFSRVQIEGWYEDTILKHIKVHAIDIVWSLSAECPSMEVPYIITVLDLQHRIQPFFPEVSAKGVWDRREQENTICFRRAAFLITGTETGKNEIESFYQVSRERIKVLPLPSPKFALGVRLQDKNQILDKYKLPRNYLFYPAQFWPHKNHFGLLMAIKILREKHGLALPVVFVGSDMGNLSYVKQAAKEHGLQEQVHFLGFVPHHDLIALYENAFALTFVSYFGPDNLPPLEAFALSCPVIASRISGAQAQLGDAALLADPKEPDKIAEAIKLLWDDESLREKLVKRGLVRANKWTARDYFNGLCSILREFEPVRECWSNSMDDKKS